MNALYHNCTNRSAQLNKIEPELKQEMSLNYISSTTIGHAL